MVDGKVISETRLAELLDYVTDYGVAGTGDMASEIQRDTARAFAELASWRQQFGTVAPTGAQYWEAQASMWHDNYLRLMKIEPQHQRYKAALERIAGANYNGPRAKLIATNALGKE